MERPPHAVLVLTGTYVTALACFAQTYTVHPVPQLGADTYNYVTGINESNSVSGFGAYDDYVQLKALRWTYGQSSSLNLGTYNKASYGRGINDSGYVVGDENVSLGGNYPRQAFLFNGLSKTALPFLLGATNSTARSINNSNVAVGWCDISGTNAHATKWIVGIAIDLQTTYNLGGGIGQAFDVNFDGNVGNRAFVWENARGMRDLNTKLWLRPGKSIVGSLYQATGINDSGCISAWSLDIVPGANVHAEIQGYVLVPCIADFEEDRDVDTYDMLAFQLAYASGDIRADVNYDGVLTNADISFFNAAYSAGCDP